MSDDGIVLKQTYLKDKLADKLIKIAKSLGTNPLLDTSYFEKYNSEIFQTAFSIEL